MATSVAGPRNPAATAARGLAFALAGAASAGGLLAQGGRLSPWLDLACQFAPVWLSAGLLAGVWALVGERGRVRLLLLGLAILGILSSGLLMTPELTRPLPPPTAGGSPFRLRLIQFNTWGQLRDPIAVADWIAGERPDMVTVEDTTLPLREALIRRGFQYTAGLERVAIFSRRRPMPAPFPIPAAAWPVLPAFSRATFSSPDGGPPFTVVVAHLARPMMVEGWPTREGIAGLLDLYPHDRLIVAGDFNLTPWSFALRGLDRRFALQRRDRAIPTWPAVAPLGRALIGVPAILPIDHVYAGADWRTVSIRRGPGLGSEHYPLVVDLALVRTPAE